VSYQNTGTRPKIFKNLKVSYPLITQKKVKTLEEVWSSRKRVAMREFLVFATL